MVGKIKCKCGSTYFARIKVNQFKDFPTDIHSNLQEVDVDYDLRIYQCVSCNKYLLPPTDFYSMSERDQEEYKILMSLIEGKVPPEPMPKRKEPIHRGTVRFVGQEEGDDPSTRGKLIPVA